MICNKTDLDAAIDWLEKTERHLKQSQIVASKPFASRRGWPIVRSEGGMFLLPGGLQVAPWIAEAVKQENDLVRAREPHLIATLKLEPFDGSEYHAGALSFPNALSGAVRHEPPTRINVTGDSEWLLTSRSPILNVFSKSDPSTWMSFWIDSAERGTVGVVLRGTVQTWRTEFFEIPDAVVSNPPDGDRAGTHEFTFSKTVSQGQP